MEIKRIDAGMRITYSNQANISYVSIDFSGYCKIYDKQEEVSPQFQTVASVVFNQQYGIPLSLDGTKMYVGNWEKGLFCYETSGGKLLWKKGPGRVRTILIKDSYLIVEMGGRGIYKRDSNTGELLSEYKISFCDEMLYLGNDSILVDPRKGYYRVLKIPELELIHQIHWSLLNPNECLSFSILDAWFIDCYLVIEGWERHKNRNPDDEETNHFKRKIKIE